MKQNKNAKEPTRAEKIAKGVSRKEGAFSFDICSGGHGTLHPPRALAIPPTDAWLGWRWGQGWDAPPPMWKWCGGGGGAGGVLHH